MKRHRQIRKNESRMDRLFVDIIHPQPVTAADRLTYARMEIARLKSVSRYRDRLPGKRSEIEWKLRVLEAIAADNLPRGEVQIAAAERIGALLHGEDVR
jgi:hypothetical protein